MPRKRSSRTTPNDDPPQLPADDLGVEATDSPPARKKSGYTGRLLVSAMLMAFVMVLLFHRNVAEEPTSITAPSVEVAPPSLDVTVPSAEDTAAEDTVEVATAVSTLSMPSETAPEPVLSPSPPPPLSSSSSLPADHWETAYRIAMLARQLEQGKPYHAELWLLKRHLLESGTNQPEITQLLADLDKHVPQGLPTWGVLYSEFYAMAPQLAQLMRHPSEEAGLHARLARHAATWLAWRRTDGGGTPADRFITQLETALNLADSDALEAALLQEPSPLPQHDLIKQYERWKAKLLAKIAAHKRLNELQALQEPQV